MAEDTHAWAPKICPSCGRPNRPQARFCSFCGAALRAPTARAAARPVGPFAGLWALILSIVFALTAWALEVESIAFETFHESVGSSILLTMSAFFFVLGVFMGAKGKARELLPHWFPYIPVLEVLMAITSLGVAMAMPEPEYGGTYVDFWHRRVSDVAMAGLIIGGFLVFVLVCTSVYVSRKIRPKEGKLDIRLSPSWLPWVAPGIAALGGMLLGFGIAGNSEELAALAFFFWTGAVMVWAAVRGLYKKEAGNMGKHPIPILAEVPLLLCLVGVLIGMGALVLVHSSEAIMTCIKIIGAWSSGVLPSAQLYSCVTFWDWARTG